MVKLPYMDSNGSACFLILTWIVISILILIPKNGNNSNQTSTPSIHYETSSFGIYDCSGDCSGHEAGYDWARKNNIKNTSDCDGKSNSFIEGCKWYVLEREQEEREEYQQEQYDAMEENYYDSFPY